ncbi:fucolectin-like [Oscarella lobularis]|uniref:fucolectin-like n=1 Tax=Oscarella lobularis TaxID=121494 RepID=UPI003313DAE7
MDRLSNFDVIVKDQSHKVLKSFYERVGGREMMAYSVRPSLKGARYVRVQLRGTNYLSLAEVDVYGVNQFATERDLARNKPATQSSTVAHACSPTASKAVDGNTEGVFYPWCSVTHTNNDDQAWWQVDLQGSRTVHSVRVFNRVDCCMERLANFNVTLRNSAGATLGTKYFAGGTNTEIYTFQQIVVHEVRYVRVHLLGKNYLSLAEVQVIGE